MKAQQKNQSILKHFWTSVFLGLGIFFLNFNHTGYAEEVNRKGLMPDYLKKYIPEKAFYDFHIQKGNLVFLQTGSDPATKARNNSWPGGSASSRMINLSTGQSFYIYESDGSYFCSNFHHDVVLDVQILSAYSVLIGMGGGGRCSLSKKAIWNSPKQRYVIVETKEIWCDPK